MGLRMKNFNIMGVPWKIRFLKGGSWKASMPKKVGAWTVCRFKRWLGKKRGWCFWGGFDTPIHTMITKVFLSVFPKMPTEIFCSKIYWQNSAKASFMYQQWTATVLIFLKITTTDYVVFFSEYIFKNSYFDTSISNYF